MSFPCCSARSSSGVSASPAPAPAAMPRNFRRSIIIGSVWLEQENEELRNYSVRRVVKYGVKNDVKESVGRRGVASTSTHAVPRLYSRSHSRHFSRFSSRPVRELQREENRTDR